MLRAQSRFAPLMLASMVLACSSSPAPPPPWPSGIAALVGTEDVVTRVNLHPDEVRTRLYAVNYQQAGLIPLCTPVVLLELETDRMRFRVEETGRTYEYLNHKAAAERFRTNLARFFGTDCPRDELDQLGELDQRGIRQGKALPGMTRRGVFLAMGPPPRHVNPTLEADRWIYWRNRFNRIAVEFDVDGRVTGIRN